MINANICTYSQICKIKRDLIACKYTNWIKYIPNCFFKNAKITMPGISPQNDLLLTYFYRTLVTFPEALFVKFCSKGLTNFQNTSRLNELMR